MAIPPALMFAVMNPNSQVLEAVIPSMLPGVNSDQRALYTAFTVNEQATRAQIKQSQAERTLANELLIAIETAARNPIERIAAGEDLKPPLFGLTDEQLAEFPNVSRFDLADDIAELLERIFAIWNPTEQQGSEDRTGAAEAFSHFSAIVNDEQ